MRECDTLPQLGLRGHIINCIDIAPTPQQRGGVARLTTRLRKCRRRNENAYSRKKRRPGSKRRHVISPRRTLKSCGRVSRRRGWMMPPTKVASVSSYEQAPDSCRVLRNLSAQNWRPRGLARCSQTKTGPLLSHFIAIARTIISGRKKAISPQAIARSPNRSNHGRSEYGHHAPPRPWTVPPASVVLTLNRIRRYRRYGCSGMRKKFALFMAKRFLPILRRQPTKIRSISIYYSI